MKTLSCTQGYFLCMINKKGNIPAPLNTAFVVCLLAGGTMELLSNGYITRNEKGMLVADKTWDNGLPYLQSLYDTIISMEPGKNKDVEGLLGILLLVVNGVGKKTYNTLYSAIGESLVVSGCADKMEKSRLSREIKYIPRVEAIKSVMKKNRTELLGDGEIRTETLCLTAFLDMCGLLKKHFNEDEMEEMKSGIEDVQKSEVFLSVLKIITDIGISAQSGAIAAMFVTAG
ncbi:MAG: hypothetical protein FWG14_10175 [Peptococcaceae bacterium]|nr:hypothetical protein [Peptococcaceae bacterium]